MAIDKEYDKCNESWATGEVCDFATQSLPGSIFCIFNSCAATLFVCSFAFSMTTRCNSVFYLRWYEDAEKRMKDATFVPIS